MSRQESMKKISFISENLKNYANELKAEGIVIIAITAHLDDKVAKLNVTGLNNYREALPILEMAKSLCLDIDTEARHNLHIKNSEEKT